MRTLEQLPIAHRNDPRSSWDAGAEHTAKGYTLTHAAQVLALVRNYPGLTGAEIAALSDCQLDKYEVRRRLDNLHKLHAVRQGEQRRCGVAERLAVTWWPMPAQSRMPL